LLPGTESPFRGMYADHRHGHNFWQALRLLNGAYFGTALAIRQGNTQSPVTGEPSAVGS